MNIYNPFGRLTKSEGEQKLQHWSKSFDRSFDGCVYHYTSAAALGAILSSRSIFCTDYRQLNDTTELSTGLEVVEAVIAAKGEEVGVSNKDLDRVLDHLAALRRAPMHMSMFAASFSFHNNDTTLWRAYAPSHGVSIGFRLPVLQQIAEEQHFVAGPVRYLGAPHFNDWLALQLAGMKEGLQVTAAKEDALRKQASSDPQYPVDMVVEFQRAGNLERWIGEVAGLLKNADFRSEEEWRCLFVHRQNTKQPQKPVRFRNSGTRVVRMVELDISQIDINGLIAKVVIGPGPSSHETYQVVADLLSNAGVNPEILLPHHPLR